MKKPSSAQVLVFALWIALASVAIALMAEKEWKNTVTLPNGEVILDSVFAVETFRPLQS